MKLIFDYTYSAYHSLLKKKNTTNSNNYRTNKTETK